MKKIFFRITTPLAFVVMAFSACTKMNDIGVLNTSGYTDTSSALKDVGNGGFIGVAIDFPAMVTNSTYSTVVKRDFNQVTFGNLMKHSSIVKDNGTMDFTNTDALVASVGSMDIFGHTLGWHSQQNTTWLKSYSGLVVPAAIELATNPSFESGLTGWSIFNTNGATIAASTATGDAKTGTGCMKVVNPTAQTGNQWKVQVSSAAFATTSGKQYVISYWVKAASAGGSIRLSTGPTSAQYQGDQPIGTAWQQVSWTITASLTSMTFLFDMGQAANTYFIDDVSVKEVVPVPAGSAIAAKLDTALGTYITTMVNRYKTKVKAWDVINELLDDNGNLRNNANTTAAANVLVWSHYLGRDYALKAFNYAKAADPSALLFINDYNLEAKPAKLDSLIAMVAELKGRGAKIDGIGTQMHITRNTSLNDIDKMFIKLAATGLKVHVSELDVRINPSVVSGYILTPLEQNYQAQIYSYLVKSYLKNVPKAQQYGITVWGLTDDSSWLYNSGKDFPLMYNADYSKKQAYAAVLQALKGL
ncbi:MAG: endo-1,4-beta-xylanase [Flavobacterium sp.]|nr:endo-1,4-beta-xylanase [Flavobacterium sp.]